MGKVDVLLGLQWGDEGKGKIVDVLTPEYDVIARFQGGPNAGHTLEFNGIKHVLHIIPSGIFHEEKKNVIGNGVLIDPYIFAKEIEHLKRRNVDATKNLYISKKAHLILPSHRMLDAANEQAKQESYKEQIAAQQRINDDLKNVEVLAKYETALALMLYCPGMTISVPTMRFSKAKRRYIERQYDGRKFTLNRLAVECGYTQRYVYKILQLLREDKKSNSTLPK